MSKPPEVLFAIAMTRVVEGVLTGSLDLEAAAARLENGAAWLRRLARKPETVALAVADDEQQPTPTLQASLAEVREVFEHWQVVTRRPKATLTDARKNKIRARLKETSATALKFICTWAASDAFFQGENDRGERYDTIETLFRSAEKVEKYLERAGYQAPVEANDHEAAEAIATAKALDDLKRRADRALADQDFDTYNALNEELREHATRH